LDKQAVLQISNFTLLMHYSISSELVSYV